MAHTYIIEIGSRAVGLVHRESEAEPFVFIASDHRYAGLEGRAFPLPRHAERAARLHVTRQGAGSRAGYRLAR